jgi:dynein heavy chain
MLRCARLSPDALSLSFPLSPSTAAAADLEGFRAAAEALPAAEGPEVFGLHANADVAFRAAQARDALALVADLAPRGAAAPPGAAGAPAAAADAAADAACAALLERLPPEFDPGETAEALGRQPGGATQPLTICLRQEAERLSAALTRARGTLSALRLALAGAAALDAPLAEALDAVAAGRPPPAWAATSWPAPTLGAWAAGAAARHEQLARWLSAGRPRSFWLGGLANPAAFLAAAVQEAARRRGGAERGGAGAGAPPRWALDDAVQASEVTRFADAAAVKEAPAEGVYVHGLFLEGAAWGAKEGRLVEARAGELLAPLPVVHVTAAAAPEEGAPPAHGAFDAPVYKSRARTGAHFVGALSLRSAEEPDTWVLRGVAVLTGTE